MAIVHRTLLETTPAAAFACLRILLTGEHDTTPLVEGRAVRLLSGDVAVDYRVRAVQAPTVVVLEGPDDVRHRVLVAPAVGDATEVVWTTSCPRRSEATVQELGDGMLRALTLAEPDLGRDDAIEHAAAPDPVVARHAMTVLDHVQLDHNYLRTRLDQLCRSDASRGGEVLAVLREIGRHESSESALLRPRLRETVDGDPIASCLDRQQREIANHCEAVADAVRSDDPELPRLLRRLRTALVRHCEAEEAAEHPRLRAAYSASVLHAVGQRYLSVARVEVDLRGPDLLPAGARTATRPDG